MRQELRCPAKLHGVMVAPDRLEVKCGSRFCGAGRGVVILHIIDTTTGAVVETKKFSDPFRERKEGNHAG